MEFPSIDLSTFYSGAAVVFTALVALWAVRKVVKLLNKS
jgi:hypothetical protein